MKKNMLIALLICISFSSFSQIQRQPQKQTDSGFSPVFDDREKQEGKYQALQDLNLSEKQKLQLKELRNSFKEKKAALDNDSSLSDDLRTEKLKQIRKEQGAAIKAILTKDQKIKLRKMMMEKKKNRSMNQKDPIE